MAQLKSTTVNGDLTVVNGTIDGGFYKPGDSFYTVVTTAGYITGGD